MVSYYKYQRHQRKSAILVVLNIAVVFFMWQAAIHYLPEISDQHGASQLVAVINIAAPIVILLLMCLASYLWIKNKTFVIQVTPTHLEVSDPMFGEYSWSVKLQDVQRIGYSKEAEKELRRVRVYMQDGSFHQLTQNYRYSRSKFYQALHKAAPHVEIEKSLRFLVKLK